MRKKFKSLLAGILLLASAIIIIFGFLLYQNEDSQILSEINNNCSGLDLFMTSKCLQNDVSEWYKYNISNIKKELSLEKLKIEGGVCNHYADWYLEQVKNLNLYSKKIIFDTDNETAHAIVIISSKEGYCVLDYISNKCWKFMPESV